MKGCLKKVLEDLWFVLLLILFAALLGAWLARLAGLPECGQVTAAVVAVAVLVAGLRLARSPRI